MGRDSSRNGALPNYTEVFLEIPCNTAQENRKSWCVYLSFLTNMCYKIIAWIKYEMIGIVVVLILLIVITAKVKACVCYFHQIFIFSQNDSPSKTEKMFFISSKKLFSFLRYSFFCNFSTLSRFKRTNGSRIVYDVMNRRA